jgi:hypothetical protein
LELLVQFYKIIQIFNNPQKKSRMSIVLIMSRIFTIFQIQFQILFLVVKFSVLAKIEEVEGNESIRMCILQVIIKSIHYLTSL